MARDDARPELRAPRLGRAIVEAVSSYFEWALPFVLANGAWLVSVVVFGILVIGFPIALLLLPVLSLPTASLTRLAVAVARAGVPTLGNARDELTRLAARKLMLASLQVLVIAVGLTNIRLAVEMGGVLGVVSGAVAAYAVLGATVLGVALWPIVSDPRREAPLRSQLRLAVAVVLRRPVELFVLALLSGLAVLVSIQLIVPALFLPSLVLLAVAGYVVPAADEIAPPPESDAVPG